MSKPRAKYGVMPDRLPENVVAKVRGDAGLYRIWGIDWFNHQILISRAGETVWMPIEKVALVEAADTTPTR